MSSVVDLQARLAARKRAAEEAALSGRESAKRWRRKGDVDAAREKEYLAERDARARARERAAAAARAALAAGGGEGGDAGDAGGGAERDDGARAPEENAPAPGGRGATAPADQPAQAEPPPLEKDEVVRRLRALGKPATLYGETDWTRFRRLRDLGLAREAEGRGQKNVFQDKMREIQRQDAVRQAHEYAGAEYVEPVKSQKRAKSAVRSADVEDVQLDDIQGGARAAGADVAAGTESGKRAPVEGGAAASSGGNSNEPSCNEEYVRAQIRRVLALWQGDVDEMAPELRRSNKGRTAAVTLEQTKEWLKPLMRQLKRRRLRSNILNALVNIFRAVEEREYVRANSFYYEQLAIGNAPWPMGATMVGIHARAAREKIGEDKIAHVMNDEQSRKYIQAIKRLISKCQAHFPTVPSKMISS